jgi:outer membrane protein TolC
MNLKKILLLTLSSAPLFALTIDEAVAKAIQNSNLIEQKRELVNISNYSHSQSIGSFLPKASLSYSYNDRDHTTYSANSIDSSYSATLSYNLFNGLSDYHSLKSASNDMLASRYNLEATKEDVILNTKLAYINYLRAKESLNVQKESLLLLQKQFEDTKIHFAQGMVAKNDLLKVEVELLSIEQNLNRAISNQKIAKINLHRLIGDYNSEPTNIKNSEKVVDIATLTTDMYNNRSELKALQNQKLSLQNKKRANYSEFLPKVDVKSVYTKYGDKAYPNDTNDERNINVTATWNIFNGNIDNLNRKKYISQILSTDAAINELKKSLNLQLQEAYEEYKLSRSNLKIAKKAKIQAKENYDIVQSQFKQGLAKTSDTLDAREYLTRAKSEYNLAYYDTLQSLYKIQRVTQSR